MNPVQLYADRLQKAGVLKNTDQFCTEPITIHDVKNCTHILQQGKFNVDPKEIKKYDPNIIVITPNLFIYDESIKSGLKTYYCEFPVDTEIFFNKKVYTDRNTVLYYHGRIIPSKLPLEELKILNNFFKVPTILRGPICKKYWSQEDIEEKSFIEYKNEVQKLSFIQFLPETKDPLVISEDLNNSKFYFTLSKGESFNLALQEAMACGTIPIVRNNLAYAWADNLIFSFDSIEKFISLLNTIVDNSIDLTETSTLLSSFIKDEFSYASIYKKFISSFWNYSFQNPVIFEMSQFTNSYFLKKSDAVHAFFTSPIDLDTSKCFLKWDKKFAEEEFKIYLYERVPFDDLSIEEKVQFYHNFKHDLRYFKNQLFV